MKEDYCNFCVVTKFSFSGSLCITMGVLVGLVQIRLSQCGYWKVFSTYLYKELVIWKDLPLFYCS